MENIRKYLLNKKRVVVKIGSSSLHHPETGDLDYAKLDILIRELCNMRNSGIDVVLVSSGAIAVGKKAVQIDREDKEDHPIAVKQACAAIGQARLMMIYQKLFAEYNQVTAQVLMTKNTVVDDLNRYNVQNTFTELFKLGVIPVVNENDSVATYEIKFGDNDSLSAIVASIVKADMLILLSDIDGLYSDDPRKNPKAEFISEVDDLTDDYFEMGKESTGSDSGTGGMSTKLQAAKIATSCGIDMVITSAKDVKVIHKIISGKDIGTVFRSKRDDGFDLPEFVREMNQ